MYIYTYIYIYIKIYLQEWKNIENHENIVQVSGSIYFFQACIVNVAESSILIYTYHIFLGWRTGPERLGEAKLDVQN